MAGYQSFFSGGGRAAAAPSVTPAQAKGQYSSFFGLPTMANPTSQQLVASQKQQHMQDSANFAKQQQQAQQQKQQQQKSSLFGRITGAVQDVGKAAKAIVRPVTDVGGAVAQEVQNKPVTNSGKFVHDTAQLSNDVTGGTVNQFAKSVVNTPLAVSREVQNKPITDIQKNTFGTTNPYAIAKKIAASTAGTATMAVGGGEVAAGKTLLQAGAKVVGKQVAKDATIGAAGNATATVNQNPNATAKEIGKSAAVGGLLGGVAPVATKVAGDAGRAVTRSIATSDNAVAKTATNAVNTVKTATSSSAPAKDLIKNQRVKSLIEAGQKMQDAQPTTVHAAVNQEHVTQGLLHPDVKQTPISSIVVPADNVHKLNTAKVNQYAQQIKDGEPVPPVITHQINGVAHVVDGQHVLAGAQKAGATHVPTMEKVPGAVPNVPEAAPMEVASNTKAPVTDTKAPTAATPAADDVHPITQAFDEHNKATNTHPDEAAATDYIRTNPEKALTDYNARAKEKFGATNVVSGDEAKYVIPGFDATKSASYHEPASALAKVKYQQLLDDTTTKDKPVLLMAGGSGAGKTSALKRLGINYDNYAAVIDTNTNKLEGASSRIDQALASGRHVQVFYVHRDPVKAFTQGVIPRGGKEGRIVPIATHVDTHFGSHETVQQLAEKYKDNPLVDITAASNNHGHGKARPLELDKVPQMKYNREQLHQTLSKEVDNAHQQGKITPEEHATYHGKDSQTVAAGSDKRTQPERTAGQAGRGTSQKETVTPKNGATVEASSTKTKTNEPASKTEKSSAATTTQSATTKAVVDPSAPPEKGTSKIAQDIQAKAVASKLHDTYGEMTQYNKINVANEAKKAVDFVNGNKDDLLKVIRGEKPLPDNLRATAVIKAVEEHPVYGKDPEMIKELAKSSLAGESSRSAQELRLAAERDPHSPVEAVKQLLQVRERKAEQRLGKPVKQAVNATVKELRASAPKATVTKETWSSFIDGLKC